MAFSAPGVPEPEPEVISRVTIVGAAIVDAKIVDGRIVDGRIVAGSLVDDQHPGSFPLQAMPFDSQHRDSEIIAIAGLALALLLMYVL